MRYNSITVVQEEEQLRVPALNMEPTTYREIVESGKRRPSGQHNQ
jgi:hypothetical protein